ncbi:hypothetical protein AbraIFM66950_001172 [Aspergillus brasiliensis]|nr:hypothetical protein AbraIFM66950_001172 [Aspergillus brasiliensis]
MKVLELSAQWVIKSIQVGSHVLLSFTTCDDCSQCRQGRHPAFCYRHAAINQNAVHRRDGTTPGSRSMTAVDCLAPRSTPADTKIKIDPLNLLMQNKIIIGIVEGDSHPQKLRNSL